MNPSASVWSGRRVLLTGHTGFKGAWLSLWLAELGAQVTGLSDGIPTERSLFEDASISEILTDRRADIRDFDSVRYVVREVDPDIILHLAAQPLVLLSYAQPLLTYATNVMGTAHVLEAARLHGNGCPVVVVTTDKCYENREWLWGYRETEAMGGHDPYSSSKGCAELVASAYARSYTKAGSGFRTLTARAGNVIGGADWAADRLIPDLIRAYEKGESVGIRKPDSIRPWQHVLEPLSGYLLLAESLMAGQEVASQGWNFGPGTDAEVTVRDVADRVSQILAAGKGWHFSGDPNDLHEAQTLRLDSTKARTKLGWKPRWKLDRALEATIEVYRCDAKGPQLRQTVARQIADYVSS
ncbi:CDP-glucose 4,6-dehydratase [Methylobacterium sp. J-076]|uniref:CDP-glucose 4,6-dehydratase n=1 Tax=Methylobacterium sp. J-076 TaxID=2836655 RepID=UPI001FBA7489|nr:CDP-glucose 4,6-dehydratase [Methylobacterium sp. J-076]MCJ2011961.1 CDP-glucose 4,6-dehydratase [Methylobacterium sp. J-076]